MAQEDLDNMPVVKTDAPRTAYDNIAEWNESPNDVENRAAAEAAGVKDASFIGYEDALRDYEARADVEPLAEKNARDMPTEFEDAAFMRASVDGPGGSSAP